MFLFKQLAALAVLLAVIVCSVPASAYSQATEPHNHAITNVIDGSVYPEMIQDKDAYRLFFSAMGGKPDASDTEKRHHLAVLKSIKLKDSEVASATQILSDFKTQYANLIEKYNAGATADVAQRKITDKTAFLAARNSLVQATKEKMESALSAESILNLHARVQREKSYMKVAIK